MVAVLCGLLWSACATGPTAVEVERADVGEQPEQASCENAAREYLRGAGGIPDGAAIRFAPLCHGYYRVSMLGSPKFGWLLAAEVDRDAAHPTSTPERWELYFLHERIVAVGSKQPHRNRTTSSDLWVVVEYAGGGLRPAFAGL